jgi:choice-of-anchor C domain-containing protein
MRMLTGLLTGAATLAAVTTLAIAGQANAADLIQNGSFENGTGDASFGSFATEPTGATNITDWTVVSGGTQPSTDAVDWINGYWQAADGTHSVDLSGLQNGGIYQDIATTPGKTYDVTFDMAGNPDGQPAVKLLVVSANPVSNTTTPGVDAFFTVLGSGTKTNMGWTAESYSFVATSTSTMLEFSSADNPNTPFGPALDNVAAFAVPEPATWSMMLFGFGGLGAALRSRRSKQALATA